MLPARVSFTLLARDLDASIQPPRLAHPTPPCRLFCVSPAHAPPLHVPSPHAHTHAHTAAAAAAKKTISVTCGNNFSRRRVRRRQRSLASGRPSTVKRLPRTGTFAEAAPKQPAAAAAALRTPLQRQEFAAAKEAEATGVLPPTAFTARLSLPPPPPLLWPPLGEEMLTEAVVVEGGGRA